MKSISRIKIPCEFSKLGKKTFKRKAERKGDVKKISISYNRIKLVVHWDGVKTGYSYDSDFIRLL